MSATNRITRVAIVGADGNSGRFITEALLKTGKHSITAITRQGSESKLVEGVTSTEVDYDKPQTLVDALKGHDALVITLSGFAPKETQARLIEAAGEAEVPFILPNEWSPDSANEDLVNDVFVFQPKPEARKKIEELGKSSYIAVVTGFWYEWSLALPAGFGIDFGNRSATLYDEGETKISTSTWPQVGRAVAALLSLPIRPEGPNEEACLENFRNKIVYVNSFTISQKEMLESAQRVTGTTESDWKITNEASHDRYADGISQMKQGQKIGFAKMMYTRVFYKDACGDFEHNKGTLNKLLELPDEVLDKATERAFERSKMTQWTG